MEVALWQDCLRYVHETVRSGIHTLLPGAAAGSEGSASWSAPDSTTAGGNGQTTKEDSLARYAEFLGCTADAKAVQSMAVMHTGQMTYATCNEATIAMLPFINSAVGADVTFYAQLQALTAGVQLVGGLAFGRLADMLGSRTALIVSHASAGVQCAIVAVATSKSALLWSAAPALTLHGYQSAQQSAMLNSSPEKREVALGLTGVSYGVGVLGGSLAVSYMAGLLSPREVMVAAAAAEAAMVALLVWAYPDDRGDQAGNLKSAADADEEGGEGLIAILAKPHISGLVLLKLAVTTSGGMVWAMAQQFALDPFGFSSVQTSLLLAYMGGVQLFSQGVLVPLVGMPSLRTPSRLYLGSAVAVAVPLIGLACSPVNGAAFVFWLGPLTASIFCTNVVISSVLSCCASEKSSGTIAALGMAPVTVAFMTSPVAAAAIYKAYGFKMVSATAATALVGLTATAYAADGLASGRRGSTEPAQVAEPAPEDGEVE